MTQAHDLKDTAAEHVGAVADEAKARAGDVVHQVRRDLETRGNEQARKFASTLRDTGSQLHSMADAGGQGFVVDMTRGLAEGSQRLAGRLEGGGLQAAGDDIRRFARRSPGLFLAGAAMAGFVVSRLVRNSDRSALTSGDGTGNGAANGAGNGNGAGGATGSFGGMPTGTPTVPTPAGQVGQVGQVGQ